MQAIKSIEQLSSLLMARYTTLWIPSVEEVRVEDLLVRHLSTTDGLPREVWSWTITQGEKKLAPEDGTSGGTKRDPRQILNHIHEYSKTLVKSGRSTELVRSVWILKDFSPYLRQDPIIQRMLKDLSISLEDKKTSVIILDPVKEIPPHLEGGRITVVQFDLPDLTEIQQMANDCLDSAGVRNSFSPDLFNQICEACLGMTALQVYGVLSRSLVEKGTLDPRFILSEKKMVIQQTGLLQYFEPTLDLGDVGGMIGLKEWVQKRKLAFTPEARLYGLPHPRGILLLGIPGCGKSLTAKALGAEFGLPVLRLDMGRVFGGLVGQSESNIRKVLEIAEATSPCILWMDEMEKGLSGSQSSGVSDGGTTARVFGTLVSWMQEKEKPVFVAATANNITQMPPELLRKGRFDEIKQVSLAA